jgi:hypothetical protein
MRPRPLLHTAAVDATASRRPCYKDHCGGADATCGRRHCYKDHRDGADATCGRHHCYIRPAPLLQGPPWQHRCYMRPPPLLHTSAAVATRATAVVPMLHAAATAIYAGNHGESYGRRQLGGLALLRTSAMLLSNANGGGAAVRCVVLVNHRRASRVAGDATRQGWWCHRRGCGVVLWA